MKKNLIRSVLVAGTILGTSVAFVPAASAALSGTCGLLSGMPHTFDSLSPSNSYDLDVLATLNFTTNQITYSMTTLTTDSSGNPTTTATTINGPLSFTQGTVTGLSGATSITFTPTGSTTPIVLYLLPVNGGNTLLVQAKDDAFHGVCEMM